jgi:Leucine-rich repeat (LRR) protein
MNPFKRFITIDITASFADPNFLAAVRKTLGKNTGDPVYRSDVSSLTQLNVAGRQISNLAGIEHFSSLISLSCYANQLTYLPALPALLEELYCRDNRLEALPPLPPSLVRLDCSHNRLTAVTLNSSTNYWYLDVRNNRLNSPADVTGYSHTWDSVGAAHTTGFYFTPQAP